MREDGEAVGLEKGIELGRVQGIELGSHIFHEIKVGNMDDRSIAETCGCTPEEVETVRRQFRI